MAMLIQNNNNKILEHIKTGNSLDYCYLCASEIKNQSREKFFKEFKALKGQMQGQPILKIRRHGEDICICKKHIKLLNDIINPQEIKTKEVAQEEKETPIKDTDPQEEKKKNKTNNKKDDKKE